MQLGMALMVANGLGRGFRPLVLGVLVCFALVATQILGLSRSHEDKIRALQEDTSMAAADIKARFSDHVDFLRQLTDDRNKSVLSEADFRNQTSQRLAQFSETIDIFYVNGNGDLTWSAIGSRATSLRSGRLAEMTLLSRESPTGGVFTAYPENLIQWEEPMRQNAWRVFSLIQPVIRKDKFLGFFAALVNFEVLAGLAVKEEIRNRYRMQLLPVVFDPESVPGGVPLTAPTGMHPDVDLNYRAEEQVSFEPLAFRLQVERYREAGGLSALALYGVTAFLALAMFWSIWAVWRDSRSSRELSVRLQVARAAAESASLAKSQLLANVSHELRTPVGAVQGYAELIAENAASDADILPLVAAIERNCSNLLELIDDLLDLSRSEAGLLRLNLSPVALEPFLAAILADLKPVAAASGLFFEVRALGDLPESFQADAQRLRQIILNLLSNAFKFTRVGRVELEVTYRPSIRTLEMRVRDTGPGIPVAQQELIFDRFYQVVADSGTRKSSMGIGLALSRRFAEAWGAHLLLESSEPGVGSCFVLMRTFDRDEPLGSLVSMVFDRACLDQLSIPQGGVVEASQELVGAQVLLVDDCADNLQIYARFMQRAGLVVHQASSAEAAVSWLEQRVSRPHAVVLDVQMPGLSGTEALALIRRKGFDIPVVGLSASPRPDDDREFDAFLVKPAPSTVLLATLSKVIGKSGMGGGHCRPGAYSGIAESQDVPPDLLMNFSAGLSRRAQAMRSAFCAGDVPRVRLLAHQLQGTASAYGIPAIAASALGLERLLDTQAVSEPAEAQLKLLEQTIFESSGIFTMQQRVELNQVLEIE
jgi:signal transduction histidine kinase/CheY-like chemotaxis protein